jgi:hypothetical protein
MARPYLLACYTNTADELICQACRQPMPFRLPDGSPYFEAVDLLAISVEVQENHLALCPTCCAKWHHARTTFDAEVLDAISAAKGLEITVTLAGEDVCVRFVQMHFDDLRTIIATSADESGLVGEDAAPDPVLAQRLSAAMVKEEPFRMRS